MLRYAVNCQGKAQRYNTLFSRPGCSDPTHFQSASMLHFPLRSSGRRILNYLDEWLILARSLDTLISHIDSLLIHYGCVNRQRAFSPPPLARSRGDESPPLVRSRGDESLPLVRSRGDEIPPLARSSRGQLSSLRLFRQGSSVQLKVFQRLLGLKVANSAVLHLGLLHMCPLQLWLEYRVP